MPARGRNRDDSMNERRRANRVDFDGEATLVFQQDNHPVSLDDISVMGARLNSSTPLTLPATSPVILTITLEDSDITLTLPAKVQRQQGRGCLLYTSDAADD